MTFVLHHFVHFEILPCISDMTDLQIWCQFEMLELHLPRPTYYDTLRTDTKPKTQDSNQEDGRFSNISYLHHARQSSRKLHSQSECSCKYCLMCEEDYPEVGAEDGLYGPSRIWNVFSSTN